MNSVSISQLKVNPSSVINQSLDYPVVVQNRNKIKAYIIGKELYEKMVSLMEDYADKLTIKQTNFSKGRDFEKAAKELGI